MSLACSAAAQDTSRDAELITSIDKDKMRYVIESAGSSVTGDLDGVFGLMGETTDGLKFGLEGKACNDELASCLGVDMFVLINDIGTDSVANQVNLKWSAIKAVALDNGQLRLSRYLILDHGQTLQNLRLNLNTTTAIASAARADHSPTEPEATTLPALGPAFDWGDDSGEYANDDACDDARFKEDGDDWTYQRTHVLRDATDCRAEYEAGLIKLYLDFGDNSGEYADDDTCDDNRFTGEGRSILTTDSHVKRDSADCIAAYREDRLNRP